MKLVFDLGYQGAPIREVDLSRGPFTPFSLLLSSSSPGVQAGESESILGDRTGRMSIGPTGFRAASFVVWSAKELPWATSDSGLW